MAADEKVTEFKAVINQTTIDDTVIESLFDLAANSLNIFGCNVPNMAGAAGSKTVTYTSPQKGAIYQISRVVYASFYKNASNQPTTNFGGIGLSNLDLMSNSTVWNMIKDIALELKGQEATFPRIAFHLGQAES